MGNCSSCLGKRRHDSFDEDDVSRMLLEDPNNYQYGSFGDQNVNAQTDPLETQRETEALERVVARTSNNLVDIFEITPQEPQRARPAMLAGQDGRLARYQNILSKLSSEEQQDDDEATSAAHPRGRVTMDWMSDEDDDGIEAQVETRPIKDASGEPLVGTFADATAAAA